MPKLLSLLAASLMAAASLPASADIKVGVTGAFTGGSSSLGAPMRDGIRLAAERINAAGGIRGEKLVLVERDDEASPARGTEIAQELVNSEKVCAVIGFSNTGVGLAAHRIYQEAKVPVVVAVSAGTALTRQFLKPDHAENYIFRNSQPDIDQVKLIVAQALDRLKGTKIAILADSTNYGQLGRQDLTNELAKRGVTPVSVEKFNVKDIDMTPQLLRAKAAGADVLLTYGIGPELAQIARGLAKLAWKVPMIGGVTASMGNFIQNAGDSAEGVFVPVLFVEEGVNKRRRDFLELVYARTGSKTIPSAGFVAQGYDGMMLLAGAIKQAPQCTGPQVKQALENLRDPVEGAIASYSKPFSAGSHEVVDSHPGLAVMGQVKGGRVVFANQADKDRLSRQEAGASR
jgi:branched-chain amino acid transport system substrate-binding protein